MPFLEYFIAAILGILAGVITGIVPGIHINLVSLLVVSFSTYILNFFSLISLGAFIISMSITHTFLDIIPAIFLGAPELETALSVLPGHALLLSGYGYEAVKLTVIGSLFSLIFTIFLIPIFIFVFPLVYEKIQNWIGLILLLTVAYMILKENDLNSRFWAFIVFLLSGILGIIVLNYPNLNQPLFPMLSGLFGLSLLITSMNKNVEIPKQYITDMIKVDKINTFKSLVSATISGSLVSWLPGMGPAQAAIIGSNIIGKINNYCMLILIGGINTVSMLISLVALYTIEKARNGSIIAIMQLLGRIEINTFILYVGISLFAAGITSFITLFISKIISSRINSVNYKKLSFAIIFFITLITFYFSSFIGVFVLLISTAIGLIPSIVNVKKSHAMGCLILPVILYFVL